MVKLEYKIIRLSLMIFLTFGIQTSNADTAEGEIILGEKMTFQIKWSFVVAGEATIQYIPNEKLNDMDVNHYLFTAKTTKFVDMFYKVRDRIDSYTDPDLTRSILYIKKHSTSSTTEVKVDFDWKKNTAQYSKNGNAKEPLPIPPDTFDPLSIFFAFRARLSDNQDELGVKVTDGKRFITARTNIIKKERIKVSGKYYNTILVEPEYEGVDGIFKKTDDSRIRIWITDDDLKIPVRFKSEVTVGSFVADLISYERNMPE